jgi:hypothetical protein
MLYVVIIIVIMNLERRFHLFQDFLIEMSNGVVYNVRSINLKKLDKPTVKYEGKLYSISHELSHKFSNFNMLVVTDYVLTIDVICKCHIDKIWCDELVSMFRGTFSSLLPQNCKIDINPLTNEVTPTNWYA